MLKAALPQTNRPAITLAGKLYIIQRMGNAVLYYIFFRITVSMIVSSVRGSLDDSINPIGICLQSGPYYGRPILMPVSQSRGGYFLQSVKTSVQPAHLLIV